MTAAEAKLLSMLRELPAPDRAWARETLRRMVDEMPAIDRRHACSELERVRQDNHFRDKCALYEAINAIPDADVKP
jgi:hypothetical protein